MPTLPLLAHFEIIDPSAYLRFDARPPDDVLKFLGQPGEAGSRTWYFRRKTAVWNAPAYEWEKTRAFLEQAGFEIRPGTLEVPRTARKKTAVNSDHATAAAAVAAVLSAGTFDISGFPVWAEQNLVIKDKSSGRFIPFKLNDLQRRLFDSMLEQWKRRGRIRKNVLKHRQGGISTLIQALFFYICLHVPGVEAIVTAHRDDAVKAVFRRTKIYEARCPTRLPTQLNSVKEIQWKEPHSSAIRIGVASDDADLGRSETRQLYHPSEYAQYSGKGVEAAGNIVASIADAPGTIIVRETTAKGQNFFYEAWNAPELEGYENFFIGFLEDPTCRNYEVGLDSPMWASIPRAWIEDEPRLRGIGQAIGLAAKDIDAALVWRRRAIPERCLSSAKIFMRENPAVADDAFVSTGGHVFLIEIVDVERKKAQDEEKKRPAPRYNLVPEDTAAPLAAPSKLVPNDAGPLRIWKRPEEGRPYIISGDFGRGRNVSGDTGDPDKLDYTTLGVMCEWPNEDGKLEEVAVWHGRMDPDEAADQMAMLGKLYNNALLVPETNHYGMILIAKLVKTLRYPRIFRKEKIDRPTARPTTQAPEAHWMEYGWWTGSTEAKDTMVEWLQEAVRDRAFAIHEPEAWDEMRTFVRDEDGKSGAQPGKHDDRVMRLAIAASYLKLHPKAAPPLPKAAPEPFSVDGLYQRMAEKQRKRKGGGVEHFT